MAFDFFENSMELGAIPMPKQMYRDDVQAVINQEWDNTTAVETIQEQNYSGNFDSFTFHETKAWLNTIVGLSSTGNKDAYDFVQLIFRCLDHPRLTGRYYSFHDNYWIEYNDDRTGSAIAHISVRRCNNWLKIRDPENGGKVYAIPCVVGYDMASPSARVTNDIITPNNHATVIVQENATTKRLFKTNARFILSGRPFKLYGYQNATEQFPNTDNSSSLMELDLYLDEIWAQDDLENGVAWNGVDEVVEPSVEDGIVLTPNVDEVREGQMIDVVVTVKDGENIYIPDSYTIDTSTSALQVASRTGNTFVLYCTKRSAIPATMSITAKVNNPSFEFTKDFEVRLVSMFG